MSWSGVKSHVNKADIEAWCKEMGIKYYTINSQGEIDVDYHVEFKDVENNDFKELPYKFGSIDGFFSLDGCKNLISLKNCPTKIKNSFYCNDCINLVSLEGCPKEVDENFIIRRSKKRFTETEIRKKCKVLWRVELQ